MTPARASPPVQFETVNPFQPLTEDGIQEGDRESGDRSADPREEAKDSRQDGCGGDMVSLQEEANFFEVSRQED